LRVAMTLEQCWHRVPGGTAAAALGLAGALAARPDVDVVGVAAAHRTPPADAWRPPPGVPVRHLPLPRLALYEAWHRLRRPAAEAATGRVDVVHATTLVQPGHRAPLAVTVHDLAFLADPSHFTAQGRRVLGRGLEIALAEAAVVLCSSEATVRACRHAGFDDARLVVVPLAPAPGRDRPVEPGDAPRRHGLDGRYVLWAGTVEPRKNLRGLLDAWRRLGRDGVDLALAGPEGWHEDLDALVAGDRSVRRLGFVPAADLAALYAGAAAVCYPSLLEGFGLPVLEAMVQGAPVVTSAGTATEELVAGGAGVAVDPRDPDALAGALAGLLDDPDAARRLGDAGRARAASYTWERSAGRTVEAYRAAVAR
ncbi:MAG TPA: glycosyltransferase family 1 protein, partial [Acidimicrobiales bacterium]